MWENLQDFLISCLSANFLALSNDRAEQATTFAEGSNFSACVKSCEIRPHPINPHLNGGHSNGSVTVGSSSGDGGIEVIFVKDVAQRF